MISFTLNMLKELFLAILIGGIIGFTLTGGIWNLKHKKDETQLAPSPTPTTANTLPTPTTNPQELSTNFLSIDQPDNQSITDEDAVIIKGESQANNTIIIVSTEQTFFIKSDKDGKFEQSVKLDGGANLIQITAIDKQYNQIDKEILITYSTAKF